MHESKPDPCPEHHPHQCAPSHGGCPTYSHDALLPLASNESPAKLGVLGVARPNEDSVEYAAKMAAIWKAKTGDWRVSPARGRAISTSSTLAPLGSSLLPITNYRVPIPSFVFAAAASMIDVVPNSPAHLAQSSPPLSPIQPRLNKQADADRTAREAIARLLNDHLEAHPEPITGAIDNPFPFADKYGIKGISLLSVFFDNLDMDTFTCRFCFDQDDSVDDALQHQRAARHYS